MSLRLDHRMAAEIAEKTLRERGYAVELDKKVGEDFSVDVVAMSASDAVIMELKPRTRIDSLDLMTLESYADTLTQDEPQLQRKKIHKILLHESASDDVEPLSKTYGIELITAREKQSFEKELIRAIEE